MKKISIIIALILVATVAHAAVEVDNYINWNDNSIGILSIGTNTSGVSLMLNWNKDNQAFDFTDSAGVLKPIRASSVYGADYMQSLWMYTANINVGNQLNLLGDTYHANPAKGVIWKKPKGPCVRQTINNDNSFTFTSEICPTNI